MANGADLVVERPVLAQCGVCLIAGVGGIIPTLARLGSTYVTNPGTPPPEFGLYIGLAIFFFIGAALSLAFEEKRMKQAFILGVCAPGIITNIVAGVSDARRSSASIETSVSSVLMPAPAFAQTTTGGREKMLDEERPGWPQVTIDLDVPDNFRDSANQTGGIPVHVVVIDRKGLRRAEASGFAPGMIVKTVSPSAGSLRFRAGNADTEVALPPEFRAARVRVLVMPDGYGWNDLEWALGGKRQIRIAKLAAEIEYVR